MFQLNKRFLWRITPATCLSLAVIIFTICCGWLLPSSYGKENGPIENLQIVVLGLAVVIALSSLFRNYLSPKRRKLYALSSVFLLLLIARELSWGRVFFMNSAGQIPPLKSLWFGPAVYPAIGVIVIGAFVYLFTKGLHTELINWLRQGNFPILDLILVITALLTADTIEHHSFGIFADKTELYEELFELASYASVLAFMVNVVFNKQFQKEDLDHSDIFQ